MSAAHARLGEGSTLDDVAAELGVEIEERAEFGAGQPIGSLGANPALARAALALDEGAFGGPMQADDGAVLFEVVERLRFDAESFEQEKDSTRLELVNQRANEMLGSLITARREELGVEYDPSFFENFQS